MAKNCVNARDPSAEWQHIQASHTHWQQQYRRNGQVLSATCLTCVARVSP